EGCENPGELLLGQPQSRLHVPAHLLDAYPVDVGDHRQGTDPGQDLIADRGRLFERKWFRGLIIHEEGPCPEAGSPFRGYWRKNARSRGKSEIARFGVHYALLNRWPR